MSDAIVIAVVTAIPATLVSLATLVSVLRNSKKVDVLKRQTDGITSQLVEEAKARVAADVRLEQLERLRTRPHDERREDRWKRAEIARLEEAMLFNSRKNRRRGRNRR